VGFDTCGALQGVPFATAGIKTDTCRLVFVVAENRNDNALTDDPAATLRGDTDAVKSCAAAGVVAGPSNPNTAPAAISANAK
jgi:hypothetical protein